MLTTCNATSSGSMTSICALVWHSACCPVDVNQGKRRRKEWMERHPPYSSELCSGIVPEHSDGSRDRRDEMAEILGQQRIARLRAWLLFWCVPLTIWHPLVDAASGARFRSCECLPDARSRLADLDATIGPFSCMLIRSWAFAKMEQKIDELMVCSPELPLIIFL